MGRTLVGATTALCGVALGLGLLRGVSFLEMARTTIALGVAAVPEGLPTVATTTLALGMHRMLRRQALVRRLEVIESLGATNCDGFPDEATMRACAEACRSCTEACQLMATAMA